MTTDTVHFAQKPSANGASAVGLLPYDIGGRKQHMHYGEKITRGMTLKSFTVYTTVHVTDSVIFITNMTFKPHNKRHFVKLLYLPQQSQRATVWPERVR